MNPMQDVSVLQDKSGQSEASTVATPSASERGTENGLYRVSKKEPWRDI